MSIYRPPPPPPPHVHTCLHLWEEDEISMIVFPTPLLEQYICFLTLKNDTKLPLSHYVVLTPVASSLLQCKRLYEQ